MEIDYRGGKARNVLTAAEVDAICDAGHKIEFYYAGFRPVGGGAEVEHSTASEAGRESQRSLERVAKELGLDITQPKPTR